MTYSISSRTAKLSGRARAVAVAAFAAFVGCGADQSTPLPEVPELGPHPRLLITGADLETLRADCQSGPKQELYRGIRDYAINHLPDPGQTDASYIHGRAFAFVYLIEQDPRCGQAAVGCLMALTRAGNWQSSQGTYPIMPMFYDQVQPLLSQAQIDSIAAVVRGRVKPGHLQKPPYYNLESNAAATTLLNGLAFHGDPSSSSDQRYFDSLIGDGLSRVLGTGNYDGKTGSSKYRGGVLPTRLFYAGDGGYHKDRAYTGKDLGSLVHFAEAMRTTGMHDTYAFGESYYQNVVDYLLWSTRPDGSGLRQTTGQGYYTLTTRLYESLAGIARQYQNGKAAWMLQNPLLGSGSPSSYDSELYCMLWDPRVPPEAPTVESMGRWKLFGTEGSKHEPGSSAAERFIYRSGWDVSTGSRDFVFHLDATDYMGDNLYWTVGGFEIFYRGALAIKSGYYSGRGDHYKLYQTQSISSNTILLWDDQSAANGDGGQQDNIREEEGRPNKLYDVTDGSKFDRGSIDSVRVRTVGDREWTLVSASYRPDAVYTKTRKATSWVRRAAVSDGIVVMYDRLKPSKENTLAGWQLHTVEEPQVGGSIVSADIPGHVVWYNGDTFTVTRSVPYDAFPNGGTLYGKRLLPSLANIRKVGGDGYEFWVDSAKPDPGGQRPQGTNYPIDDADAIYNYREAGAWRMEIYPTQPTPEVEFMVALQTNDGQGMDPFTANTNGNVAGFVHDGKMIGFARTTEAAGVPLFELQGDARSILLFDLPAGSPYELLLTDSTGDTRRQWTRSDDQGTVWVEGDFPAGTEVSLRPALEDALVGVR